MTAGEISTPATNEVDPRLTSAATQPVRVTALELFFDLVFVFTITQLTHVLFEAPNARGVLQVVLMLGVIWWMYGGYAWLTNAVSAHTDIRRLLLLGGMGGYFVVSLAVPHAFSSSGLAFGVGYLIVVLVHSILFTRASSRSAARAILTLAPFNLVSAAVILLGGAVGGTAQYVLWALAVALEWLTPKLRRPSAFEISPSHFVERHGLVMIIAIGESVVAVGIAAGNLPVDAALVTVVLVGLALSACLWWLHFVGVEDAAESALAALPQRERSFAALNAFGYLHLPLLLGVVAIASVERQAFEHPFDAVSWARAGVLAGGVVLFLCGEVLFRRALGIGPVAVRGAAAILAPATIPIGATHSAFAQLAAVVALLTAALAYERFATRSAGIDGS